MTFQEFESIFNPLIIYNTKSTVMTNVILIYL